MINKFGPLKVGIGGPVGAGKTSLTEALCKKLSKKISMAVISNDIYTIEDAEYLMKVQALPLERIKGVETGGCPHTAIREDASINLLAVDELKEKFPDANILVKDLAGDNNHYSVIIESSVFNDLNRVQQHQLVYQSLDGLMDSELHAMQLQTKGI